MPSSLQLHRINPIKPSAPPHTAAEAAVATKSTTREICPIPSYILAPEDVLRHHTHAVAAGQCCSAAVQAISTAPLETVWSLVRRFDKPEAYKRFLTSCRVVVGDGGVGTLREVRLVSGLPAEWSMERLEVLDDEGHVTTFSVVGGDHRLRNYRSVKTLHAPAGGGTVVVESYVVDVPPGNTAEETRAFVDTIVRCNLRSLAEIATDLAMNGMIEPELQRQGI